MSAFAITVPAYFLFLTYVSPTLPLIMAGIVLMRATEASAAVTVYSTSMDYVRSGREGTDFTIQVVLVHISGSLITIIAGGIGQWLDYRGLCIIELVLSLVCVWYVFFKFNK